MASEVTKKGWEYLARRRFSADVYCDEGCVVIKIPLHDLGTELRVKGRITEA